MVCMVELNNFGSRVDTRTKTEKLIEDQKIKKEKRTYLGISGIADPCPRKIWYNFRWAEDSEIDPRVNRLLNRGHREEKVIVDDLSKIGIKCSKVLEDQDEVSYCHGHIKGHPDGYGENIPDAPKTVHLLEFKTANEKNFKKYLSDGVRKTNPVYYGQICCYMFLKKIDRCLFIVVNKNNDERYYERVEKNHSHAKDLLKRGEDIISSEIPPKKIGGPSYWICKYCEFYEICHFNKKPALNCRTCKNCDIYENGAWQCSLNSKELSKEDQEKACSSYLMMEGLK